MPSNIFLEKTSNTVSSTPKDLVDLGLSAANLNKSSLLIITARDQAISYWLDGENPATDQGHRIAAGDERTFYPNSLFRDIVVIAETGTAKISASIYT